MAKKQRPIRYAVVGAGNIAQTAVMPAFQHARDNSRLVALVSSDPVKRRELGERYELELTDGYEMFESLLDRGQIDAVYIATPNSTHKELTLRAAKLGVHVLCEKPLAPTVADCEEMARACKEHGVKLMVAYRLHFEEATLQAIETARSGKLGELRVFSSTFTHVVRPDDVRRDASRAGGATLDLGVYCINTARNLFAVEPSHVFASGISVDGADDTTLVQLRFPGGALAQFCVSNSIASVSSYRLAGSRGDLRAEPAYDYSQALVHYTTIDGDTKRTVYKKRDQFAPELSYFSDCILGDHEPEPSAEEAVCDARVIEAVFESLRTQRPVELPPHRRHRWPTFAQQRHDPPINPPPAVHAPSPSER